MGMTGPTDSLRMKVDVARLLGDVKEIRDGKEPEPSKNKLNWNQGIAKNRTRK